MKDTFHLLYETGDADAPAEIKDRNGEVVLALCRVCRRAEGDLTRFCYGEPLRRGRMERECGKVNPPPMFDRQTIQ